MSYRAAVITVSDKGYRGERTDTSGPAVCRMAGSIGCEIVHTAVVPDEAEQISAELRRCADEMDISLILTTGGTGLSPRDVTPEATLAVLDREARGIAEAMRAESMRLTPRGCLSRGVAGTRGRSLIVNLPGSERAAVENLGAVLPALEHGLRMLSSLGSAECAQDRPAAPSVSAWLREAKAAPDADRVGMYLVHNGVVRATARDAVRGDDAACPPVTGMCFSYDEAALAAAIRSTRAMPGIYYVRAWLNRGELRVGDDLMVLLVGGDIRPHVTAALEYLLETVKTRCVTETERYADAPAEP